MKLPHMPLWVYDVETDETCALMSPEAFGIYVKLLMRQWIEGSIPADEAALLRLLRLPSERYSGCLANALAKFSPCNGNPDRLANARLTEERDKAVAKVEKNRLAGRKGGLASANAQADGGADAQATAPIRAYDSDSNTSSSGKGGAGGKPEDVPIPLTLDTEKFRQAWADWVKHRGEIKKKLTPLAVAKALKALEKLGHDRAISAIEHSIANGWTGIDEPANGGSGPGASVTRLASPPGKYDNVPSAAE